MIHPKRSPQTFAAHNPRLRVRRWARWSWAWLYPGKPRGQEMQIISVNHAVSPHVKATKLEKVKPLVTFRFGVPSFRTQVAYFFRNGPTMVAPNRSTAVLVHGLGGATASGWLIVQPTLFSLISFDEFSGNRSFHLRCLCQDIPQWTEKSSWCWSLTVLRIKVLFHLCSCSPPSPCYTPHLHPFFT